MGLVLNEFFFHYIASFFFFFLINLFILFIYFWLRWAFGAAHGLSLVAASGLLVALASLVAEHGL